MRWCFLLILTCATVAGGMALHNSKSAITESVLIDLGECVPGSKKLESFCIRNNTSSSVPVVEVRNGCGCSRVKLHGDAIPKRGTLSGEVAFTVPASDGSFRKVSTVVLRNGGIISVVIEGRSVSPYTVEPSILVVGSSDLREVGGESTDFKCQGEGLTGLFVVSCPEWCRVRIDTVDAGNVITGRISVVVGSKNVDWREI